MIRKTIIFNLIIPIGTFAYYVKDAAKKMLMQLIHFIISLHVFMQVLNFKLKPVMIFARFESEIK